MPQCSFAHVWESPGNEIKDTEGQGGKQKTCLTIREQEKEGREDRKRRMWAEDKVALLAMPWRLCNRECQNLLL